MCNKRILCKFKKDEDTEQSNITEKQRKILLKIKKYLKTEKNKEI